MIKKLKSISITVLCLICGLSAMAVTEINVKDYGAQGDGSTNDTTAIQNAINYAVSNKIGKVIIPSGTYMLDTITLPSVSGGAGVTIEGRGNFAVYSRNPYSVTTELKSRTAVAMFNVASGGVAGYRFKNLHLNGNDTGTCGWQGNGLEAFCSFENLVVTKFTGTGMEVRGGLNTISYCYVTDNGNGVYMGSDGRLNGCYISGNNGWGARVKGGTFVTSNEFASNGSYGIYIEGSASQNISISGNYIENNAGHQVYIKGNSTSDRNISKIKLFNNYFATFGLTAQTADAVHIENARTVQIVGLNYIGSNGSNTGEGPVIKFVNSDSCSVSNVVAEKAVRGVVKLVGSELISISNLTGRDYANETAAASDRYGISLDSDSRRVSMSNIQLIDYRSSGSGGCSKGIDDSSADGANIMGYTLSTPVSNPDNIADSNYTKKALYSNDIEISTLKINGGSSIKGHLSLTQTFSFSAPSVPGFTTTQYISNANIALGDTVVASYNGTHPANAVLYAFAENGRVALKWMQICGTPAAVPSGEYRVDVWMH